MKPTIVLPLLKPAMATQAIFGFVASWNNLYTPSIILATERQKQTMPMYVSALKANDKSRDWGQITVDFSLQYFQFWLCTSSFLSTLSQV